tara:strand:+ start:44 stop:160 length:117 start_codon:yes stop_codon:yes gene_type:complete
MLLVTLRELTSRLDTKFPETAAIGEAKGLYNQGDIALC